MGKLKVAFYWAASCGGCEVAVLDINEKILDVVQIADIVFWPVAMDVKYHDVEAMPDKSIDICFFNGAIRNEENEHLAKLLRQKAKTLVAFGSCASEGGVVGLGNLWDREAILERAYIETPSTVNPQKTIPQTSFKVKEGEVTIPKLFDTVRTLDQVVDVDYYLPGCPPPVSLIAGAVDAIAKGALPPKGSVLAPQKSVCDECSKVKKDKSISEIKRVYEVIPDKDRCLLEQGIICKGLATRGGCGAQCLTVNMPCTGCGGPCPNVLEQGAATLSALSSILGVEGEKSEKYDAAKTVKQIKDPVGVFYLYSLPHSIIKRRVNKKTEAKPSQ